MKRAVLLSLGRDAAKLDIADTRAELGGACNIDDLKNDQLK
jgi:hypothetical protein